jgi:hypothetical protein
VIVAIERSPSIPDILSGKRAANSAPETPKIKQTRWSGKANNLSGGGPAVNLGTPGRVSPCGFGIEDQASANGAFAAGHDSASRAADFRSSDELARLGWHRIPPASASASQSDREW